MKRLTNNTGSVQIDFNYANYDKVGNRKSCKVNSDNAQVYDYDKLYQLTFVDYNNGGSTSYDYDKLGNRTIMSNGNETNYEANRLNQYVKVGDVDYQYDNSGNLTYDGIRTYWYDCENRLTGTYKSGHPAEWTSYSYDFAGRRVSKTHNYTMKFCHDGDQLICDYIPLYPDILVCKYIYGPGIDEPICIITVSGPDSEVLHYYHFDGLGSVVALSDESGNVVEQYSYDVFGQPNFTGSIDNRFLFTGREYDGDIGLYYYRARYYSPTLGRFMQTDPIGNAGGLNLYSYCLNNPLNWIDPYGLDAYVIFDPHGGPGFFPGSQELLGHVDIGVDSADGGILVGYASWGSVKQPVPFKNLEQATYNREYIRIRNGPLVPGVTTDQAIESYIRLKLSEDHDLLWWSSLYCSNYVADVLRNAGIDVGRGITPRMLIDALKKLSENNPNIVMPIKKGAVN